MSPDNKMLRWAPKISQIKVRRLYELDSQSIIDLDLINDVGWALWERCESILTVTTAHYGHVLCPTCGAVIERQNPWTADENVECTKCDWHIPWATYHQSYRGKQLFGANAVGIFEAYHKAFPLAQKANEKMLLIDQLIHAFHVSLKEIGRPVAANLIEGSLGDVIHFLDRLTSGDGSATGIGDSWTEWRRTLAAAEWSQIFIENDSDTEERSSE